MRTRWSVCVVVVLSLAAGSSAQQPSTQAWPQWGGPNRDFTAASKGLATTWPANGPRRIWTRALGEGHSAIAVDAGRLYTMYRPLAADRSLEEAVAALDASTGKTIWEYRYASPTTGLDYSEGAGPHATPAVTADRVFATGSRKEITVLNKADGKLVWSRDMHKTDGAPYDDRGFACSPLLYGDMLIVPMGGKGQAIAAFNQRTGALLWKSGNFESSPSSPTVIDVDGQKQILYFAGDVIAGLDPANGQVLWTHPHKTSWGLNISTPVWSPSDHLLFVSSAYGTGSRAIELRQSGGKTSVTEKWHNGRMRIHIGSAVKFGNVVVGSSGDFGPAFLTGIDVTTGKVLWQDRSFARAQLLQVDGTLVLLDEDGTLGLATVSPSGLRVLTRASVLQSIAWTPPSLAGTRLYVRDRRNAIAFELGS